VHWVHFDSPRDPSWRSGAGKNAHAGLPGQLRSVAQGRDHPEQLTATITFLFSADTRIYFFSQENFRT